VPARLKKHPHIARLLYANLGLGIEIIDFATLYEICFQKVPLSELEEVWFLENVAQRHELYDILKRPLEMFLAASLGITLLPLGVAIIAAIKFTSPGSAFFSQRRVGRHGHNFTLWKFRTMRHDAECNGPVWAKPNDSRITVIGRFLRQTHLDELPQLWNILRGDLSFVGPRPERPEFTKRLAGQIPFYELRHLVRPGLTGWAQINYRYGASTADAYEKQQYDIFYLKHRSFWIDFLILLKTARRLVTSA
jgi:lipopolysaccharide/colanic/teichoic acid biosynthesis glycosyltransferase